MEDTRTLIDSSVIVEFLRKRDKRATKLWELLEDGRCAISAVTLFELLAGANSETHRKDVALLASRLTVLPVSEAIAENAAEIYRELRRRNHLIDFRDIFIAATARSEGIALSTFNARHFRRVDGLKII